MGSQDAHPHALMRCGFHTEAQLSTSLLLYSQLPRLQAQKFLALLFSVHSSFHLAYVCVLFSLLDTPISMAMSQISLLFKVWLQGHRVRTFWIQLFSVTLDFRPPTSMMAAKSQHDKRSHVSLCEHWRERPLPPGSAHEPGSEAVSEPRFH